jgi:glycosyltransferase involved in cell wall biosynthesis
MRIVMGSCELPASTGDGTTLNVLHVVPSALGRGAQIFARALVDELGGPANGHLLVSLFDGPTDIEVDVALALPGGAAAAVGLNPRAVARLIRPLSRLKPDLLVAHGGDAFKYLALAARAPIAYCVIGTWPTQDRQGLRRRLWRALVRRAWVAAVVSDDVAADCRMTLGVPGDRLLVIPNGRDAHRFRPPEPASRPATHGVRLLFIGRLDAGKRPDRFVEAVRSLRDRGLPVTGMIVGDGPLRGPLERSAAGTGIEFSGFCDDVVPHLQAADILVFPSAPDGEGMPGVLIEAGLCGLPTVATDVAGASTVIDEAHTGLLVPHDDMDALVGAVTGLARDPARRREMGVAARAKCEAEFALPVVAATWDMLLHVALASAGRGTRRACAADLAPLRPERS